MRTSVTVMVMSPASNCSALSWSDFGTIVLRRSDTSDIGNLHFLRGECVGRQIDLSRLVRIAGPDIGAHAFFIDVEQPAPFQIAFFTTRNSERVRRCSERPFCFD